MAGPDRATARPATMFHGEGKVVELVRHFGEYNYIDPITRSAALELYHSLGVALIATTDERLEQEDRELSLEALVLEGERPDADLHPSATMREHIESL